MRRTECSLDAELPCSAVAADFEIGVADVEACRDSYADYFSCLRIAECDALEQDPRLACADEHAAGRAACPERFTFCAAGMGSAGADACGFESTGCIDGLEQTTACAVSGMTGTCTCMHGDAEVGSFEFDADPESTLPCNAALLTEQIASGCSFPT